MKRFAFALLAALTLPVVAAEPAKDATKPPINLDIGAPTVVIVKHSLAQRTSRLVRFYEAGEIGLGQDGLNYLRDSSKMTLAKRQIAEKLIDVDNQERKALIQALADSNGRRHDEAACRRGFSADFSGDHRAKGHRSFRAAGIEHAGPTKTPKTIFLARAWQSGKWQNFSLS